MALAKQREADLETMKGRTMAKSKEMASEKQQLEERIRALESGMAPVVERQCLLYCSGLPEAGSSSSDNY